jgi:hypothetical protein
MEVDQFLGAMRRSPFRPFTVVSMSGEKYPVPHPEQCMVSPSGKTVAVFEGEVTVILDMAAVSEIVAGPSRKGGAKRATKGGDE